MDPFLIFIVCAAGLIGLALGSYIAALSYRLPRGVRGKRSACPSCGHILGAGDLVPVLSWIILCGRCRYCDTAISPRYMVIEIITALFMIGVAWVVFAN